MVKQVKRHALAALVPVLALGLTLSACSNSKDGDAANSSASPSGSQTSSGSNENDAIKPVTLSVFIDSPVSTADS